MLKNYFTIALRNLIRNRAFSAINILGLALGLACSLLILLWVQDERRVDGFHLNGKQLYQVYIRQYYDGKVEAGYGTQGILAGELKRAIPELQYSSALEGNTEAIFQVNDKSLKMQGSYAGVDFFNMFTYPLLQGTSQSALRSPGSIAISRRMAEQFFTTPQKAIGKTIRFDNSEDLLVSAVFENLPAQSSLQLDFLRTWDDYLEKNPWAKRWGNYAPLTFVQLRREADPVKVEAKIKDFIYRYKQKEKGWRIELALQPYPDRYLHSNFKNGQIDGGRIQYVHLFSLVAVFILLIGCVNFMNLSTSRATKRAKEVGIRKVVGAVWSSLVAQFIGEAVLLTCLSSVIAVMLVMVLLPAFNTFTGKELVLPAGQPVFWILLAGMLLLTGLVAGSYPALFLSSLKPIGVLKGSMRTGSGAIAFRKALVVFQFALSVLLMVGMIVVYRQMQYVQSKNLGYDRENLVYIPIEGELIQKYDLFKQQAGNMPGILSISRMRHSPTVIDHGTSDISWAGKDPNLVISFANELVGYDFVKTLKLTLKEGRDFSRTFGADSTSSFLINETAAEKMGYTNPVGQPLQWGDARGTIIGVLKDFHFASMHQAIGPLVIRLNEKKPYGTILVRTEAGKTQEALTSLEKVAKALNPQFPFAYQFSDLQYAKLYQSEQLVSQLSGCFAFLAIFISCLGLLGLAIFTAEQRVKEIGIRKVLGASVASVVMLLIRDFLRLVLLAIIIASPLAWYLMQEWLDRFAYKIHLAWWMFCLAGLLAVVIALVTISMQSLKAALINPVKSLRSE